MIHKVNKEIKLGNLAVEVEFVTAAVDDLAEKALAGGECREFADLNAVCVLLKTAGEILKSLQELVSEQIKDEEPEVKNVEVHESEVNSQEPAVAA